MNDLTFESDEAFMGWVSTYFREAEIEPEEEFFERSTIPSQAEPDHWITQLVLVMPASSPLPENAHLLPQFTYGYMRDGVRVLAWMFLMPVVADRESKSLHLLEMIKSDLEWVYKAHSPKDIPSPWVDPVATRWTGKFWALNDLRAGLKDAGEWKHTLSLANATKGGRMTSDKKKASSAKNAQMAREAMKAKALRKADELISMVDAGKSPEEMAQFLDISVTSIPVRVSEARKRLREQVPDSMADLERAGF